MQDPTTLSKVQANVFPLPSLAEQYIPYGPAPFCVSDRQVRQLDSIYGSQKMASERFWLSSVKQYINVILFNIPSSCSKGGGGGGGGGGGAEHPLSWPLNTHSHRWI